MEATIKFDLSGDDKYDFDIMMIAQKMSSVIWDLNEWIRNECKYKELTEETYTAYDNVREKLFELMDDNSISMDDLV